MKLRVRINKSTSRLELDGSDPTLSELRVWVRDSLLPECGFNSDVQFSLSLNGKEVLLDTGQTLFSCGVVSGDLISVIVENSSSLRTQAAVKRPSSPSARQNKMSLPRSSEASASSGRLDSGEGGPEIEELMEQDVEEQQVGVSAPPPLLCCYTEEGKIPLLLQKLLESSDCQNPLDCLMVVVHLLLLEMGFQPEGGGVSSGEMPAGWRGAGGLYRLQYTHRLLESSTVYVVGVPMGKTQVVLNAAFKANLRTLQLNTGVFVTKDWASGSTSAVFQDLGTLSRLFKDQVVHPLMAIARYELGLPALFGLLVLPPELLLPVLRLLDFATIQSLSMVCRYLHRATQDPSLWRHLLHRDFKDSFPEGNPDIDRDWKGLYKKKYKETKDHKRLRGCLFIPPVYHSRPAPFMDPFMDRPPLYPPGLIIGDHDRTLSLLPHRQPIPRVLRPGAGRAADIRRGLI